MEKGGLLKKTKKIFNHSLLKTMVLETQIFKLLFFKLDLIIQPNLTRNLAPTL